MKISKGASDFNKEILFGEIGAILGAPTFGYISSKLTSSANFISASAVAGAIIGAAIFWILTRIYDQFKRKSLSKKKFFGDLVYFTPVAFVLTLLVYYPSLFFMSRHLIESQNKVISSVILSQIVAFALFLTAVNIYRYLLLKFVGKEL